MDTVRHLLRFTDPAWLTDRWSLARWAPLPLRLIVGYGFMAHGYSKIVKHPDAFAGILHALGVPAPHFMAWATIVIELLGGLAVYRRRIRSARQSADDRRADRCGADCSSSVRLLRRSS